MEKVIRDGRVAVLHSPGFGAGWYTWNAKHEACLFDPEIVAAVEAGKREEAGYIAERKYEGFYSGGAEDLEIEWIPVGTEFEVEEYDGSERISYKSDAGRWITA